MIKKKKTISKLALEQNCIKIRKNLQRPTDIHSKIYTVILFIIHNETEQTRENITQEKKKERGKKEG